ncbi:hypothetical protein D1Q00_gp059 [Trichoplusia ni granulovirus LBIV-12]|uniref:Uncharacterized protein n=2 Tax=Betabaculovirus TaxID=558017 RepID=A0A1D8QL88_GVTN|nr:hypothetical protein PsunGV_gp068 [Pseudalatia unipuncta granulovirus]YP_009506129.1 hypothetical protein D1Q00_gp059 [Trichoplusia ni granulovirus LBIV-12]ACH69418.1 unknown [Pseudalatia unipuncta granulovirus]AOW41398.1 hypothetical protein [Trichoplusia ni granulovirus LBIV-12]
MDNFDRTERLRSTERLLRRLIIIYHKLYTNMKKSNVIWQKLFAISLLSTLRFVERTLKIKIL